MPRTSAASPPSQKLLGAASASALQMDAAQLAQELAPLLVERLRAEIALGDDAVVDPVEAASILRKSRRRLKCGDRAGSARARLRPALAASATRSVNCVVSSATLKPPFPPPRNTAPPALGETDGACVVRPGWTGRCIAPRERNPKTVGDLQGDRRHGVLPPTPVSKSPAPSAAALTAAHRR